MMEDVLNDESENISLSQLLDIPTLTAHSNTIYTLAVNTTGGTPEEKASRHVTLVGTTNVFSL
jgi:hypothetical protein